MASEQGPLPHLLVGITFVTGLVDAFSYVALGHVFVANMTGNSVFFGFALAGVGDVSVVASLLALVAFLIGAAIGGRLARMSRPHRGRLLAAACAAQSVLVLAAAIVAVTGGPGSRAVRLPLVALLALAMGSQNAVVRRLGLPEVSTNVLTTTLAGLAGDPGGASSPAVRARRVAAVVALVAGACAGGALLRWVGHSAPLWAAAGLLLGCAAVAFAAARSPRAAAWH
ncbi:YoaK family protein [Phytohabitans flavus]|uniref:Membrane protein n=1 Tax=Phytohabitans flavus TaxID=1076124 RepID=A0A6F8XPD4_9ACTN|nr:YoaK family protein [Phytohabitans flavus]BCB75683.1 membrane protein [Phytohabitans flavus]